MNIRAARLIAVLLTCFLYGTLQSQVTKDILMEGIPGSRIDCSGQQYAGTAQLAAINASSTAITENRMFLCYGDQFNMEHNGNAIFNGDPVPATPPGVGYAWYECPPSSAFAGPDDLAMIIQDPCVFDLVDMPTLGIFIYTDQINGDALFQNVEYQQASGDIETIPEYYNNDNPIEIWFAPITFDRLNASTSQAAYESGAPCTHVNVEDAFSVVYLNPVSVNVIAVDNGTLSGSFSLDGGLPEFDGSEYDQGTITMYLENNPGITATLNIPAQVLPGTPITFTVPMEGRYIVEVNDGISCPGLEMIFIGPDPVELSFGCVDGQPGDTICIPITVNNFENVVSAQFEINWDPNILEYVGVQNFGLANISGASDFNLSGPNALKFIPFGFDISGESVPDGTVLFEVCFRVTGIPGSNTTIQISPNFDIEIVDNNSLVLETTYDECVVNVLPAINLAAFINSCGAFNGIGDGSFTITVFGGAEPYMYSYVNTADGSINGSGNILFSGFSANEDVPPGNYEITITDTNGESQIYTIDVDLIATLVSITSNDPTCFLYNNGNIIIEAADGTAPYSFVWEDLGADNFSGSGFILTSGGNAQINSLPAGNYLIEVTDAKGCTFIFNENLDDNPIEVAINNVINASCQGAANGVIDLSITGGNPAPGDIYTFDHLMNPTLPTNPGGQLALGTLEPGTYTITIYDEVPGCFLDYEFTIGADEIISGLLEPMDESCPGSSDGSVSITGLTNGAQSGIYDFVVLDSNKVVVSTVNNISSTFTLNGLSVGDFYVVINEGVCLSDTLSFNIGSTSGITASLDSTTIDDCLPVFQTGMAFFNISGGILPYTLDAGSGTQVGNNLEDLEAGLYQLTVSDANGCTTTVDFEIINPDNSVLSFVIDGTPCTDGATLTVLYNGNPISGQSTNWNTGELSPTVSIAEGDTLSVNVADNAIHCLFSKDTIINCPESFGIDLTVFQPLCNSTAQGGPYFGSVLVDTMMAVAPVTYIWAPGDTTVNNGFKDQLTPGTYIITVTDALDSMVIDTFEIIEPDALTYLFSGIDSVSCPNICDGEVDITPLNGIDTLPYFLFWDDMNGPQTDTGFVISVSGLCVGNQNFTVSQDGICFYLDSVLIPGPDPVGINVLANVQPTCFGDADGILEIEGTGGTPSYSYLWDTGSDQSMISDLDAGYYMVTITDARSCEYVDSLEITQPDSLVVIIDSLTTTNLSCGNQDDAQITLNVNGGNTGGYNYTWNPDVSNASQAFNLGAGLYTITVTDMNGCSDTTSHMVTSPPPIQAFYGNIEDPPCFGDQTLITVDSAAGGNGGFTFSINNGQLQELGTPIPASAGMYSITVFDSTGCFTDTSFIIAQPDPLLVSILPSDPVVRLGDSILLQSDIVQAANPIVGYSWGPGIFVSCDTCANTFVTGFALPTPFTLTVVDANDCIGTAEVLVQVDNRRDVYIPNIFSPNNDGRNEEFLIYTGQSVAFINSAQVFDRWGELLTSQNNLAPSPAGVNVWDGRFKSQDAQPGVYVYLIEVTFLDGEVLLYRGDITLIR